MSLFTLSYQGIKMQIKFCIDLIGNELFVAKIKAFAGIKTILPESSSA